MTAAMMAEAKATASDARAPQISRDSTSRPNSSRPSGLPGTQAASRFATSWRSGSISGSTGAAAATSTMNRTMAPGISRRLMNG